MGAKEGTVTITATAVNADGNEIDDVTEDITLNSDVATDQIEGNRVTFPTASEHTITATHAASGVSGAIVITVNASVADDQDQDATGDSGSTDASESTDIGGLATTGFGSGGLLLIGAMLLTAGCAVVVIARRRATAR